MTNDEFNRAFTIAESNIELNEDASIFYGFALPDFKKVHVTLRQVASLIRWQAQCLNGNFEQEALQEVANYGRHRFIIVGKDSDDMIALRKSLT